MGLSMKWGVEVETENNYTHRDSEQINMLLADRGFGGWRAHPECNIEIVSPVMDGPDGFENLRGALQVIKDDIGSYVGSCGSRESTACLAGLGCRNRPLSPVTCCANRLGKRHSSRRNTLWGRG